MADLGAVGATAAKVGKHGENPWGAARASKVGEGPVAGAGRGIWKACGALGGLGVMAAAAGVMVVTAIGGTTGAGTEAGGGGILARRLKADSRPTSPLAIWEGVQLPIEVGGGGWLMSNEN